MQTSRKRLLAVHCFDTRGRDALWAHNCCFLQARFLNAFVRTQKSRQQVKSGKAAWLDDERALREQERKADAISREQFESMASSWLPPAVTAKYRQQLQQCHGDQRQLRMDKRGTVERTKSGALDPGKAAFLAKLELQLAANLGKEAYSLEKAIKCAVSVLVSSV